ncbi:sulfite exporter TauE/SafE family protein [Salinisphaera sp. Q1T1-3]|uniref:sulfite exporter TauE/SafE family protein n=1 Tax=Salinisphaera sp. Q1T1-3 TaxID=2321229 RepID=UPI001313EE03|nr:sulfite exporter TauE/SafE family protein [Salinisphaera sp. Q1T1-3]
MLSIVFGIVVGLALGLTGGGGSIFAVPLLVYGLGLSAREAIAISLVAVALTAGTGVVEAARRRVIEWRAGLIFALAGVAAAPAGVWLGQYAADGTTLGAFALLMLAVALRLLIRARHAPAEAAVIRARIAPEAVTDAGTVCHYARDGRLRLNAPCSAALVVAGLVVGVLSGFFGVGGGFLIVPALILITDMGIHRAVATSLFVITLVGLSGVVSNVAGGRSIDPAIAGLFVLGGAIGMIGGRGLARYLAGRTLQLVFAILMAATGLFMLAERLFV